MLLLLTTASSGPNASSALSRKPAKAAASRTSNGRPIARSPSSAATAVQAAVDIADGNVHTDGQACLSGGAPDSA